MRKGSLLRWVPGKKGPAQSEGFKSLDEGQAVSFEAGIGENNYKPQATNVRILS